MRNFLAKIWIRAKNMKIQLAKTGFWANVKPSLNLVEQRIWYVLLFYQQPFGHHQKQLLGLATGVTGHPAIPLCTLVGPRPLGSGENHHWLGKNISQLFTQGGRRSHSQHAVMQTTGIEETRLASESSRKEKKERSADWIKKKLPVRQDMVSTHESNPKHAIGRKRHGNLPALYVAWRMTCKAVVLGSGQSRPQESDCERGGDACEKGTWQEILRVNMLWTTANGTRSTGHFSTSDIARKLKHAVMQRLSIDFQPLNSEPCNDIYIYIASKARWSIARYCT